GIEESRFILSELSGKPVSAFRLRKELEEIINVFACPGLSIHQELKINVRLISFRVFRALTAIVREGLSNVIKHSGAQNVWIHLYNDKQFFFLNIRDDGNGFLPDILSEGEKTGHFGIYNIKKRVKLVHGRIRFRSSNQGTTIEAKIPFDERGTHVKGKNSFS
ncbi:MAG: sensor histidine kinase, partial [Candidatus Caldatribacteriaceae bacterium]